MFDFITRTITKILDTFDEDELDDVYKSFITGNELVQTKSMNKIIPNSFDSNDLSFLGFHVTMLLSSQSIEARIVGFRAASVFLTKSSPYVEMMPAIYRKAMRTEDLIIPALQSMSFYVNPFVFHSIENEVYTIAESSNDTGRKLALTIIFRAYLDDQTILPKLMQYIRAALFQPSLKYTTLAILCEVVQKNPLEVGALFQTLISEIPFATPVTFSKLSRILCALLALNPTLYVDMEKSVTQFVSKQDDPIALIDAANLISRAQFSSTLYTQLGSKLQNIISVDTDPNVASCVLNALKSLSIKFKPSPSVITPSIESVDSSIRGPAIAIRAISARDHRSSGELYKFINETKDITSVQELINVSKNDGAIFVSVIIGLYDLAIPGSFIIIAQAIQSITDKNIQKLFLKEVSETIFEPPDDPVGLAIAWAISEWSTDPQDIRVLIPPLIATKSEHYQSTLINYATAFWLRLQFDVEFGIINRISVLTQSSFHEVRNVSAMFLDLIETSKIDLL